MCSREADGASCAGHAKISTIACHTRLTSHYLACHMNWPLDLLLLQSPRRRHYVSNEERCKRIETYAGTLLWSLWYWAVALCSRVQCSRVQCSECKPKWLTGLAATP